MKARFDKGALNVAVFDQRIKDFQSSTFVGTGFVLANAGIQRTRGVEIEGRYSPIEQIDLTAAATFLDPKYIDFPGALGPNGTVVDRFGRNSCRYSKKRRFLFLVHITTTLAVELLALFVLTINLRVMPRSILFKSVTVRSAP